MGTPPGGTAGFGGGGPGGTIPAATGDSSLGPSGPTLANDLGCRLANGLIRTTY